MAKPMTIAAILAAAVAALLAYAATKPDTIQVRRAMSIETPPDKVFALINDLHRWDSWADRDRSDPPVVRTYGGSPSGRGAISWWQGSGKAGTGRMEITESEPRRIVVVVDFVKPFEAHNINEFSLAEAVNATTVTWTWTGTNVYVTKVMSIFVNMDTFFGSHFETALANLKILAEKQ